MFDTLPQTAAPVVFIPLSKLEETIDSIFTKRIREKQHEEQLAELISPDKTCELFDPKISKVTLSAWTDKGLLTKYFIGGRTYYRRGEVVAAAVSLKKYSRQS